MWVDAKEPSSVIPTLTNDLETHFLMGSEDYMLQSGLPASLINVFCVSPGADHTKKSTSVNRTWITGYRRVQYLINGVSDGSQTSIIVISAPANQKRPILKNVTNVAEDCKIP